MKRRPTIAFILLSLALITGGVILNIAVAWAISLRDWPTSPGTTSPADADAMSWWNERVGPSQPPAEVSMFIAQRIGSRSLGVYDTNPLNSNTFWFGTRTSHGWPLVSMEFTVWYNPALQIVERRNIIAWDAWPATRSAPRGLPLRPIWPAFAINTIFYAFILWLIFIMPFALRKRRRIRRGLCVKCAYPIGLAPNRSSVCTECGHPAPPPPPPPPPPAPPAPRSNPHQVGV